MTLAQDRAAVLSRNGVSRETLERLDRYAALLVQWQAHINLIAPSTLPELWSRHLEEGLRLARLVGPFERLADLGSGGGLPGLVLAIAAAERGAGTVTLVESNGKKAAFLRHVVRDLGLPAEVRNARIEAVPDVLAGAGIVTARALAPLADLLGWVGPHLGPQARCFFPKGRQHDGEIEQASAQWRFDMVKHPSTGEAGSVILEIHRLTPRTA